ncbi:cytochrome c [Ramlibacter sp. PS3R-8]|uniref:c-type cytochrome n=1 Tax=Ramlibacter sp. PS3R-8 TaxID=3133437 RepID=UPI0030A3744C
MKLAATLAIAASACALSSPASAQFAKPEDAVKYRQSAMFLMSQHFGRIGGMANGRIAFDAKGATENAEVVSEMSKMPWQAYVVGTDKVANTRAKPEIWSEQAKFNEYNQRLMSDTTKLVAAAKTNNLDNLKKAFGDTAATCKACHDNFRRD